MHVLVCGGAGYIGSHACIALAERGHSLVVADNFANSARAVPARLEAIIGRPLDVREVDLRDRAATFALFAGQSFDAVVHFAALKAVGESCERPLDYFENNIGGTIHLLQAMRANGVRRLVFSSSATVYGDPAAVPVREDAPLRVTNPYGRSKLVMEELIGDVCRADPAFRAVNLRYFNPVGAHASGTIGEDPGGIPNNLMPYICQTAVGRRPQLSVFGGDWPTVDGTGVRDYIHVVDLARAHADALDYVQAADRNATVNLGTGARAQRAGTGAGVRACIGARGAVRIGRAAPGGRGRGLRRPDAGSDAVRMARRLDVDAMCRDAWRWQSRNPDG